MQRQSPSNVMQSVAGSAQEPSHSGAPDPPRQNGGMHVGVGPVGFAQIQPCGRPPGQPSTGRHSQLGFRASPTLPHASSLGHSPLHTGDVLPQGWCGETQTQPLTRGSPPHTASPGHVPPHVGLSLHGLAARVASSQSTRPATSALRAMKLPAWSRRTASPWNSAHTRVEPHSRRTATDPTGLACVSPADLACRFRPEPSRSLASARRSLHPPVSTAKCELRAADGLVNRDGQADGRSDEQRQRRTARDGASSSHRSPCRSLISSGSRAT
jgi:hypothetical protein